MKRGLRTGGLALMLALATPGWAADGTARHEDVRLSASAIRDIQQTLNDRGFAAGPVDGVIGNQTRLAIRNLQEKNNLEVTGTLNEATLAVLGHGRDGDRTAAQRTSLDDKTIRAVQQQLNARGFNAGPLDGVVGAQTKSAIRSFQEREGLPVTGTLDRQTISALGVRTQG